MCWHKWTKWKQYEWRGETRLFNNPTVVIPTSEQRQERTCEKCGYKQIRKVDEF